MVLLLENKANVDKAKIDDEVKNDGVTPLIIASQEGHLKVAKFLVEEGKAEEDKALIEGQNPL